MRAARSRNGFSLVELAIVILVMSVIAGAAVTVGLSRTESGLFAANEKRMERIKDGFAAFLNANGYIPCPADPSLALTDANYGRANCAATCTCTAGCSCASPPCAWVRHTCSGMVPIQTLNLIDDLAFDGWGRRYTYAVDQRFTELGYVATGTTADAPATISACVTNETDTAPDTITAAEAARGNFCVSDPLDADPAIAINDVAISTNAAASGIWIADLAGNLRTDDAIMALVSHGPNGRCARDRNGAVVTCAVGANTAEQENGDGDRGFQQSPTRRTDYDDVVHYLTKWQLIVRAGGFVDTQLCEKAARIAHPACVFGHSASGGGTVVTTGPVGCTIEAGANAGAQHVGCTSTQIDMARHIMIRCYREMRNVCTP